MAQQFAQTDQLSPLAFRHPAHSITSNLARRLGWISTCGNACPTKCHPADANQVECPEGRSKALYEGAALAPITVDRSAA
jgi:hypothetical protein